MPTFDALFLGSFVADVIFCLFAILIQIKINYNDENSDYTVAIIKTVFAFVIVWVIVAGGAVLLARKCSWESDIFEKFITASPDDDKSVYNTPSVDDSYVKPSYATSTDYAGYNQPSDTASTNYNETNYTSPSSDTYIKITNVEYSQVQNCV